MKTKKAPTKQNRTEQNRTQQNSTTKYELELPQKINVKQ